MLGERRAWDIGDQPKEGPRRIATIGIGVAKKVFQLHGVNHQGKTVEKKRLSHSGLVRYMANLPAYVVVGMEICGGVKHWSRFFYLFGYEVRLMSPQFVKPYVKV